MAEAINQPISPVLSRVILDLELDGLYKARIKYPSVIIRDNGYTYKLMLRGQTQVLESAEVPKERDLVPFRTVIQY
jgi:hypothetical protein